MEFPTTHLDKLKATLENVKLPVSDRPVIEDAIGQCRSWQSEIASLRNDAGQIQNIEEGGEFVEQMTLLLQRYKTFIDINVIFDSRNDFLYRQKGQLKFDNSIIEEFIPHLVFPFLPVTITDSVFLGPRGCFSSITFSGSLANPLIGGGMLVRTKNQDFALSRELFLKTSYDANFEHSKNENTFLAYIAAEMKTNLDKTMFQEACATAHDVKTSVAGSKYFLLCEWLDMTPLSTAATDIDEVLILRGKRLGSQVRKHYATYQGRNVKRTDYENYLSLNPFRSSVFLRLISHILATFDDGNPIEEDALLRGYF